MRPLALGVHLMADATLDQDLRSLPSSLRGLAPARHGASYRKGALLIEEGSLGTTCSSSSRANCATATMRAAADHLASMALAVRGREMSLDGGPRSASVMAEAPTFASSSRASTC